MRSLRTSRRRTSFVLSFKNDGSKKVLPSDEGRCPALAGRRGLIAENLFLVDGFWFLVTNPIEIASYLAKTYAIRFVLQERWKQKSPPLRRGEVSRPSGTEGSDIHQQSTINYQFISSSISSISIGMFFIKLNGSPFFWITTSSSKRMPIPSSGM